MRVLCVGRHRFLGEHLARVFGGFGVATEAVVGLDDAPAAARRYGPDVVICDYDLLATMPLETWERDSLLSRTPVIAVSMTRHPEEACLLDVNGIAGFLYLPTLRAEDALRVLGGAVRAAQYTLPSSLHWQPAR